MIVRSSVRRLSSVVRRLNKKGCPYAAVMRDRKQWFEKFDGMYYVLWWVPAGTIPTIAEAKERLDYLDEHGETAHAFTFRTPFPAPQMQELQTNAAERS